MSLLKKIVDIGENLIRRFWLYLILIGILALNIPQIYEDNEIIFNFSTLGMQFFLPLCVGIALIVFLKYVKCSFAVKVLVVGLVVGILFAVFQPVSNGYDENQHLFKTIATLDGKTIGYDSYSYPISDSYYLLLNNSGKYWTDAVFQVPWAQTTTMSSALYDGYAMPTYPSWGYVFCCIGMKLAMLFGANVGTIYVWGRIANVIGFMVLAALAIAVTPYYKRVFALFALMPVTIIVYSSYSQDSVTYGLILLIFALFLKWRKNQAVVLREFVIWSVLMLLLVPLKLPYLVLLGLLFMLPKSWFKFKGANIWKIILILAAVVLALLWFKYVSSGFTEIRSEGFDKEGQRAFVLGNPFKTLWIFLGTIFSRFKVFMDHSFYVSIYPFYVLGGFASALMLIYVIYELRRESEYSFSKYERVWLFIIALCGWTITNLALYLTFSPVGDLVVEGVQGRYISPLLVIVAMFIPKARKKTIRCAGEKTISNDINVIAITISFSLLLLMAMLIHHKVYIG